MTGEVETHAQNSIRGHWRRIAGGPNNGIGVSIGSAALAEFGHSHRQRMRRWKVPRAGRRMSPFRVRPLSGRRPGFLCQGSRMWGWTVPRAGRRVPCFRSWTLSARLFWPLSLIGLGVVRRSPPASLRRDNLAPVGHDPNFFEQAEATGVIRSLRPRGRERSSARQDRASSRSRG